VNNNKISLLIGTIICIGEVYYDFQDVPNAIFAFNEARQISEKTQKDRFKIRCYMGLANCCFKIYKFSEAMILLKKALQYAWRFNDRESELEIYDKIGFTYFSMKDIEKALYYHNWFILTI